MDELRLRLFQQLLECLAIDGFDEVRVESGALGAGHVCLAAPAGQRDDTGTPLRPFVRSKALAHLESVHSRHAEVEQDDIGLEVLCPFQRDTALVLSCNLVAHGPQ